VKPQFRQWIKLALENFFWHVAISFENFNQSEQLALMTYSELSRTRAIDT
jgi:hypothetical protein